MASHFVGGIQMITEECCNCGVSFAMTADFQKRKRQDRTIFYCPAGHKQHYTGESEEEKLRRDNQNLKQQQARYADIISDKNHEIKRQKNKVRAEKGAKTKLKRRVAHGNCPCCKRSFANLERHMKSQHPEEVTNVA